MPALVRLLFERCLDLVFPDTSFRIAGLIQVLLLCLVTHHLGVRVGLAGRPFILVHVQALQVLLPRWPPDKHSPQFCESFATNQGSKSARHLEGITPAGWSGRADGCCLDSSRLGLFCSRVESGPE